MDVKKHLRKDIACLKLSKHSDNEKWESVRKSLQKVLKNKSRCSASTDALIIAQLSEMVSNYEEQFPLNNHDQQIYINSKADLEERMMQKSRGLVIRSKAKWIGEGEKNTRYFCSLERARANAKSCHLLIREDNSVAETNEDIIAKQAKFYKELYSSDRTVKFTISDINNPVVPKELTKRHNTPFTLLDIKKAMCGLKRGRTPGPDDLPMEVYEVFWDELGEILFNAYKELYSTGHLFPSAFQGILNLIPKSNKDTRFLKNLRPITLLNADYKIVEKALATRIYEGMDKTIHEDKTAFMSRGRMAINIRKILDMCDFCANVDRSKSGVLINLDFLKAFDRVEINSVLSSLKLFGFAEYLISWVKILYKDFTVKVQNYGHFSETVNVERSVHQGGVSSAFLFNILVETLAITMRQNTEIKALQINNQEHLLNQYADDTEVSSEDCKDSVEKIFSHLDWFQTQSGLQVQTGLITKHGCGELLSKTSCLDKKLYIIGSLYNTRQLGSTKLSKHYPRSKSYN